MTYHDYEQKMKEDAQVEPAEPKSLLDRFYGFFGNILGIMAIGLAVYYVVTIWYPQKKNEREAYHKMYEMAVSRVQNLMVEKCTFKAYDKDDIEFQDDHYEYDFGYGCLPYKYYVVKVTFTDSDGETETFNVDSYWHYSKELIDGKGHNLVQSDRIWNDECRDIEALKDVFDSWNEIEKSEPVLV